MVAGCFSLLPMMSSEPPVKTLMFQEVLRQIYRLQSLFLPFHLFHQPIPQHQGLPTSARGKNKKKGKGKSGEQAVTGENICQH